MLFDDSSSMQRSTMRSDLLQDEDRPTGKTPVTSRQTYAGLKILPSHAYRKLRVPVTDENRDEACETNFQCLYRDSEGTVCHKTFVKSTSLIVHYQRHINLRPFSCKVCGMSFTQSGTLARHSKAIHKVT